MTLTPRPYQLAGRDFLAGRRHALLADEMRVGKTPQAILAAHKLGAKSIFVVCPAIAVPQWQRELLRWWPDGNTPRAQVLSYDKARTLWESGARGTVDVFIPDECHFAKNPEATRTKMVYGKDGFAHGAGATWPISGTPAPKHAGELWPMLKAFGLVGANYTDFCRRYCRIDWLSQRPVGTKEKFIPELRALLSQIMLRRTRKEVAPEMPEIGFDFLEVKPGNVDLECIPEGVTAEWLEANASKIDRQTVAWAKVGSLVEEVEAAVREGQLRQTVIFGWHTAPLKALAAELMMRGIETRTLTGETPPRVRESIQAEFREGVLQVLVANVLAAGTAVDLSAASHGYFLELDWVGGNNVQAANRLVSMDKHEPVTFDVVTWRGSADDRVQQVLLTRARELSKLF